MRIKLLVFIILIATGNVFGQAKKVEINASRLIAKDTAKVIFLLRSSSNSTNTNPIDAIHFAEEALIESKRIKSKIHEMRSMSALGFALFVTGNYSRGLKTSLEGLQLAKWLNEPRGIVNGYSNIGNIYRRQGNYKSAIENLVLAEKIAVEKKLLTRPVKSTLGICYLEIGKTDLAMKYLHEAYQLHIKEKSDQISLTYNRMGDLHIKLNNTPLALTYYQLGVEAATKNKEYRWLCFNYLSLADLYFKHKQTDLSIMYARKAIETGNHKFLDQTQQASVILSNSYDRLKRSDSSLKYLRFALAIKDTIQNNKEEAEIQNLLFEDRLQKMEAEEEKARLAEERAHNLQYSAIAVSLILFILVFLSLSHSRFANKTMIRFLGVLSLLIIFEFINLLLHPYLGELVHHSPVLMLFIMVLIASLLIPLHHKLEHWITEKLIEKNARIRLASAKRTIKK